MTKQFLCCLSFEKPLIDFHFDEKLIHTKRYTSKYVIPHVKRLSYPALCGWSGAFSFRV